MMESNESSGKGFDNVPYDDDNQQQGVVAVSDDNNDDDVWGSHQGYTPLETALDGGNGLVFSLGPAGDDDDNDDDDDDGMPGTFFANNQALTVRSSSRIDNHDGDECQTLETTTTFTTLKDKSPSLILQEQQQDDNFLSLADQALRALEEDYQLTVQGGGGGASLACPEFPARQQQLSSSFQQGKQMVVTNNEPLPDSFAADFDAGRQTSYKHAQSVAYSSSSDNDDDTKLAGPLFQANFDVLTTTTSPHIAATNQQQTTPVLVDTDKVRHAVQNISLRPNFDQEMQAWERHQKRQAAAAPLHHAYIPHAVCRLFRPRGDDKSNSGDATSKNAAVTQQLSRVATLVHALHRLDILGSIGFASFNKKNKQQHDDHDVVVIHILGCDAVEASSLVPTFGPLVSWMQQENVRKSPRVVQLHLIGPNLPSTTDKQASFVELVTSDNREQPNPDCRLESVQVSYHKAYYHEWRQQQQATLPSSSVVPDLLMAYHPGFWGYDTWKPTLEWLAKQQNSIEKVPLVATSYTLLEAEEDEHVLEALSSSSSLGLVKLWECEYNPFASHQERPTATAVQDEEYRENSAWQAWRI